MQPFALDETRRDRVDSNLRAKHACQAKRQVDYTGFGSAVGDGTAGAGDAGHTGGIDDHPAIAGFECLAGCPGALERPLQIHAEDVFPIVVVHLVQIVKVDEARCTGIVD